MGQDLRVGLFHLPIVGERIELVSGLGRSVFIGPVPGVVIFEE